MRRGVVNGKGNSEIKKSKKKKRVKMLVTQSCLTLCNPMDCSQPGSSVHGILQARILEWIAMPSSRGSSQPRNQTRVSCAAGRFFIVSAIRKAQRVKGKQLIILCFAFSCESPVHGICVSTPYCPSPSLFFFPSPSLCQLIHCPSSRHVLASS